MLLLEIYLKCTGKKKAPKSIIRGGWWVAIN